MSRSESSVTSSKYFRLRPYKRHGRTFLGCNLNCANAYKTDRKAGLMYGAFRFKDGRFARNWEQASAEARFCAYCGATDGSSPLTRPRPF